MTKEEVVRKNLDLHAEFMRYTFEHPEVLDKIPKGAQLVILPNDEQELYNENIKIVNNLKEKGLPVVVVKMPTPKPIIPEVEVISK